MQDYVAEYAICSHGVVGGCRRDDGPTCGLCKGEGKILTGYGSMFGPVPTECPRCLRERVLR